MGICSVGIAPQQSYHICKVSSMGATWPLSFDPLPPKRGPLKPAPAPDLALILLQVGTSGASCGWWFQE